MQGVETCTNLSCTSARGSLENHACAVDAHRQWGCCSGNLSPTSSSSSSSSSLRTARRGAARRSAAQVSAAPSSCHRPHWLTEQQHVGAYLTDQPPSPPRRTEEPAIGGTADARWRSAAWAAPTRRDRPEERVSAIITGSRSIMRFEIAFQRVQGNVVFFQLRAGGGRRCRSSSQSALPGGDRCCS